MFPSKVMFNGATPTQRPQERELDKLADDKGDDGGRNTEPLEAVGGAQGEPDSKKVLGKSVFIEPS